MSDEQVIKRMEIKPCDNHWELLKTYVKRYGLWQFVATTGDQLKRRLETWGDEETIPDPVIGSLMLFVRAALENGFDTESDHTNCPLCAAEQHGVLDTWLKDIVEEGRKYYIDQGWLKEPMVQ